MHIHAAQQRDQELQELLLQGTAEAQSIEATADSLVAGHELGGVVPGVGAGGVSQVLVQVGNGTLQKGRGQRQHR